MSVPTTRRVVETSGAEALWLLEGAAHGRLVFAQREQAVVRPAVHVLEYGRLIVRAPVQADLLHARPTLTYQVDEIRMPAGSGWSVTVTGPAEPVAEAVEAAHYRRTLPGWAYGPHDTLLRITPQTVTGYRLGTVETR
ncbi:pyridoxamine 5'-phosphate oxidase family protein [Streptomyces sp. SKN60]|uniref:pyridoxamine 5'-phosphate oxidase family protein n=1 Tax=Streptomyces sp. SKN60 TaxID=2855506 RepID=UPI00224715E0|nr:pyridoxamine 5'-phosphate oxidase family protein [Streptomyces sp. SKN60]MCX2180274.1 pyridoxamine 5'-phosphate oxidase family protein [Streptomyces sp. SKN60]